MESVHQAHLSDSLGHLASHIFAALEELQSNLAGNCNVFMHGERFYDSLRANHPSGIQTNSSGRLGQVPSKSVDIDPTLESAELWSDVLGSPFCSLDIAYDLDNTVDPHLAEFPRVNFGPATAENSSGYYVSGAKRLDNSRGDLRIGIDARDGNLSSHRESDFRGEVRVTTCISS